MAFHDISAFHELMSTESAQWHHLTGVPGVLRATFQSGLWHSMPPLRLVRATCCTNMFKHSQQNVSQDGKNNKE